MGVSNDSKARNSLAGCCGVSVLYETAISQYHDWLAKVLDCNSVVSEELCAGPSVSHRADDGIHLSSPRR